MEEENAAIRNSRFKEEQNMPEDNANVKARDVVIPAVIAAGMIQLSFGAAGEAVLKAICELFGETGLDGTESDAVAAICDMIVVANRRGGGDR